MEHNITPQATGESAAGIDFTVKDSVAWVTLNRPKLRNAVSWSVPTFLDTRLGCQLTELPIS
jgi:1,4-dihydroxy-2-naphthoyl-CoA synthase